MGVDARGTNSGNDAALDRRTGERSPEACRFAQWLVLHPPATRWIYRDNGNGVATLPKQLSTRERN